MTTLLCNFLDWNHVVSLYQKITILVCKAVRLTFSSHTSAISFSFILIPWIIAVFQLKHPKTPGLEIFKMWSTIFCNFKINGDISKCLEISIYLINQNCHIVVISSYIFKAKERSRPPHEKLVRNTASFF